MKKSFYFILLAVEFFVGMIPLALVSNLIGGWTFMIVVAAVWVVLMALQLVKLAKAKDEKAKRKAKVLIALVMLLPAVAAFAAIFIVVEKHF